MADWDDLAPGTRLEGRYEIVRCIGQGGFASVYEARHLALGSTHAIKVLDARLARDGDVRSRFLDEGRIQAQLRHTGIVGVTEIVTSPVAGLVMEYVDGPSLATHLDSHPRGLPEAEALSTFIEVLDAVGAAHQAGIVHRDLKPDNVLLSTSSSGRRTPKVTDFGVARILDGAQRSAGRRATRVGAKVGTLLYMSPEQIAGAPDVGPAADIFALGAVLYEMIVGRAAFDGASEIDIAKRIVGGHYAPLGSSVATEIRSAVARALAVHAAARFRSCAEFRDALRAQDAADLVVGDVQVEVFARSTLCFAMEQSALPLVDDVIIRNGSGEALRGAAFVLELKPDLGEPHRVPLPLVGPGDEESVGAVAYRVAPGALLQVVESTNAQLVWSVELSDRAVARGSVRVDVLARDEWPGLRAPPGLLTTFVVPNHPVVRRIVHRVRDRLGATNGGETPAGYATRSDAHVSAMVIALYDVLQSLAFSLADMPGAFETEGARIRLPDRLLEDRSGTCLDLSLLMASCLEQMRLNPILVILGGDALVGVWLGDDRFPEGLVEDPPRLRNLVDNDEIVVFDPAALFSHVRRSASESRAVAKRKLASDIRFRCALDVRVLQTEHRYRPLPWRDVYEPRVVGGRNESSPPADEVGRILAEAAREPRTVEPPPKNPSIAKDVAARFQQWQGRLLDLSLRNRLLNFGVNGRTAIRLDVPDLPVFEDLIAAHTTFKVVGVAAEDHRAKKSALHSSSAADMKKGQLVCNLTSTELQRRAKVLDRDARTDLEEGGANTLYAAIGFLRWFEAPSSEVARWAPLLLYPVGFEFDRKLGRIRFNALAEEPVANITLVEKMRRDFDVDLSALLSLEPDESGIDVPAMLGHVRRAIRAMSRWEVVETAFIGRFTFTKYLMWRDLEEHASVFLQNQILHHIAASESRFPAQSELVAARGLDASIAPDQLPCVLDADSTQMAAIASALQGRSFVLQGPPGTGKSQTITNLIAALIANDKTVLFVSEKMAALEVVHRRLEQVGLGDFCLEVHSHKTTKKHVLESLERAYGRPRGDSKLPWAERSSELGELRARLNVYVGALHAERPLGNSVYAARARVLSLGEAPEIPIVARDLGQYRSAPYRTATAAVSELAATAARVEPAETHPWRSSNCSTWSEEKKRRLLELLGEGIEAVAHLENHSNTVAELLGIDHEIATAVLPQLAAFAEVVGDGHVAESALAADWGPTGQRVRRYTAAQRAHSDSERAVSTRWEIGFWKMEREAIESKFARWAGAFFVLAFLFLWSARRAMRAVARSGHLPSSKQIAADLAIAREVDGQRAHLRKERAWLQTALGELCAEEADQLDSADAVVARSDQAHAAAERLGLAGVRVPSHAASVSRSTASRTTAVEESRAMTAALYEYLRAEAGLIEVAEFGPIPWPSMEQADRRAVAAAFGHLRDHVDEFRQWCKYQRAATAVRELGVGAVADAHLTGTVSAADLEVAFEKGFLRCWSAAVRDAEPALAEFDGAVHHHLVTRFATEDRAHIDLGRARVAHALDRRIPSGSVDPAPSSEPGLLLRELKKQRRHLPIRKLLQAIPNLLPRLKPCFLMSPLSVAQYLPAGGRRFDLVVFDEASQICTHDAVGAMARGDAIVIVGDSKQLPPTSFFRRSMNDDDGVPDDNDVVELESVLDEALVKRIPQQTLGWHYRSRHQSLIEFSNRHYYETRLHVFPAAGRTVDDLGLRWHPVPDGVYLSGGDRTNPREAARLVEHLVRALRRHSPADRTFGVVTFGMAQQFLLQDLLDEARAKHPEIEPHFVSEEPLFVKNLENVQGDERDEIYFSVTYARDLQGRLRMHFGPLSNQGGERRLNVVITRARYQLHVFSTLTHHDIDLGRTASVGASHLRAFLEFAARAGSRRVRDGGTKSFATAFEHALHDAIVGLGYEVDTNVGCGAYRIDLAVVHPKHPESYALGVECDGLSYGTANTARDRDRLRADVLSGLGWALHRVWSSDWWFDRDSEARRLSAAIEHALSRPMVASRPVRQPVSQSPSSLSATKSGPSPASPPRPRESAAPEPRIDRYPTCTLTTVTAQPDLLYEARATPLLRDRIAECVRVEGPVHKEVVFRRVMTCWGVQKLTARCRRRLDEVLTKFVSGDHATIRGDIVWPAALDHSSYRGARDLGGDDPARALEHVPPEELANVLELVLSENLSLETDALIREAARLFGIRRVGRGVGNVLAQGQEVLRQQKRCVVEGARVVIVAEPPPP